MLEAKPSRTALRVAVRRAAHQILEDPPVFSDPLALAILGPEGAPWVAEERTRKDQLAGRTLRAFLAARSRYAEDELARAVEAGVRQYVLLGAGLDTFACRNPYASAGLRVYEVDFPSTQQWKRELLTTAGILVPDTATFVPMDFEHQTLASGLRAAGFQTEAPAFFACLGVVPYLTDEAFTSTLEFIASLPHGSGIAFDYAVARSALNLMEKLALDALAKRVAAAGEPFQLFFEPETLARRLRLLGFERIEDLGRDELNERYFLNRVDEFRLRGGLGRIAGAWL
ncbi:class I SAM-dependent methyltransferase [Paludibaculum fermentans]|uniref:S-adenosyl-L-methionine-dependent methyltransferase n=1 Tax=Paludibaculum fermentans TaxID=1473598 RepID=A0A7S7NRI2_PALFE|nr:class I SAM-dependent methyltransferase [Paludibaculum fermentans]QOY88472.1 class I SAM-dependent methyltransferase [Paludibaculum fermentans]